MNERGSGGRKTGKFPGRTLPGFRNLEDSGTGPAFSDAGAAPDCQVEKSRLAAMGEAEGEAR